MNACQRATVTPPPLAVRLIPVYRAPSYPDELPWCCARSTIETMERETGGRRLGGDEVEEMQRAVTAWQAQATEAQQVCSYGLLARLPLLATVVGRCGFIFHSEA